REFQPLRRAARDRHRWRAESELHGRIRDVSLDRSERRSFRAGERGQPHSVHHGGRRLQSGGPDGSDIAEHSRCEPQGAEDLELSLIKRLSNKWMARVGFSLNNALEHFASAAGQYDTNGNPTPTLSEPLKDGGQFAPQSGGSGSGNVYINATWQFNANALYQA